MIKKWNQKNMKECDKWKSHISSKLPMIYRSSNNVRHPVNKTFTTLHPATLHSITLHLLALHFTFVNCSGNCHYGAQDSTVFTGCHIWPYSYRNIKMCSRSSFHVFLPNACVSHLISFLEIFHQKYDIQLFCHASCAVI